MLDHGGVARTILLGVELRVSSFQFLGPGFKIADVAELADALASGASARKGVEVRVLSSAYRRGPASLLYR